MLKRSNLHDYQVEFIAFVREKKKCGLFLDMGLGKTTTSLTAASDMLDDFFVTRVLIIAPLRVANTVWEQEAKNWEHLRHLDIKICTGNVADRTRALNSDADIHVINRENIPWLVDNIKWRWDMVIVDESSSFKNHTAKRFKAMRKVLKYVRSMVLLTGTPTPKGLINLWPQLFLIDQGERLGKNITAYRNEFFKQDYSGFNYIAATGSDAIIKERIKDVCVTMKATGNTERIDLFEYIEMPSDIKKQYKELEKEFLLSLTGEGEIEAPTAAVLSGKLLQMCNGAVYDADGKTHQIHDLKIKAMKEMIEDNPGENFLVAYNYKSDLQRLQKAFPNAVTLSRSGEEVVAWNEGKIGMLLAHPASAGHGLNIQHGGSVIIWFGLNWSLELYQQFNARLHRQGQKNIVRIMHIIIKDGLDEKVLEALRSNAKTQDELIEYLKFNLKGVK